MIKQESEQDLLAFIQHFWHILEPTTKLVIGWPLEQLCDLLMAVTDGHLKRIIINLPPGFSKSLTLAVWWPAWELGPQNMPSMRYISASYSASLTERDNGRLSRLLQHEDYRRLWGDRVKLTKDGVGKLETEQTGWKLATSVGGTVTGNRARRFMIDDGNNPATVESELVRASTNLWIREIVPDRLEDLKRDVIINLQQRTHEDDCTGTLAKYGTDYSWWTVPMEYDPLRDVPVAIRFDEDGKPIQWLIDPRGRDANGNELAGRFLDRRGELKIESGSPLALVEGTLAWPERFSDDDVIKLKTIKGPFGWSGQYQQAPSPRGGGIIRRDWWKLWPREAFPALGTVVASLDTAIKEGEANDYNAFVSLGAFTDLDVVGGEEPALVLTSAWQGRMSLAELIERTASACFACKADYLLIEDKARGHDVAAEIVRQYDDATWQTILIPANGRGSFSGDKEARLRAVSVMFSGSVRKVPMPGDASRTMDVWTGGMVYEPGMEWSAEVVDQVSNFPATAHDDYVDALSQALAWVRRHGVVLPKREYDRQEYEAKLYRRPTPVPYTIRAGGR